MNQFITTFPKNILACFAGKKWIWHIIAIVLTFVLVMKNVDWYYFIYTRSNLLQNIFFPTIILGGLIPLFVPIFLFISGYIFQKRNIIIALALAQAGIIGGLIAAFYKSLTGRIQPDLVDTIHNISHNFNFGFLKHGVFWGWPSSHTTIAFAMSFTLIYLFPKNKFIRIFAFLYALYIGIGVSLSIHWFSDFVAGAIIGTIVGIVVAKSFRNSLL